MASRSLLTAASFAAALSLLLLCCAPAEPAHAATWRGVDGLTLAPGTEMLSPALAAAASSAEEVEQARAAAERQAAEAAARRDKRLAYDPALIEAVGNQTADGHWGCCPGYSCAYGDAIITGQATDHSAYTCRCCTWPGWGGGDSSFRSLGSNEALLREAYDEIAAGRPTVIHVAGASGEHWICLMGYQGVEDPDALTLDNFLALDPVTGEERAASDGYALYGDFCEHVSDLR